MKAIKGSANCWCEYCFELELGCFAYFTVRLPDDSLTAEARCAAAIASSMEPKEVFLLHVLDQRRVLFIEKCILLATSMRGPDAIGEMSWHVSIASVLGNHC